VYPGKVRKYRLEQVYRRSGRTGEFIDKARIECVWVGIVRLCRQIIYLYQGVCYE